MKKTILLIFILASIFILTACQGEDKQTTKKETTTTEQTTTTTEPLSEVDLAILNEMKGSFDFFWKQANTDKNSAGYGLISDRAPNSQYLASIASVGFGLTALPIGIENGWITYEAGYERALGTLNTFKNMYHVEGFYYHFVNRTTGERAGTSEISSIDTGLFLAGALFAGEYFGDEVKQVADELYARVNWNFFIDPSRKMFRMAYFPENDTFSGYWDFYAEQLILYVLGAGSPNPEYRMNTDVYYSFIRHRASYGDGEPFIHSWFGSIFTYQYSHAWIDFRNIEDKNGVNWFQNSVHATIANRQYAIDQSDTFETFGENSWGMTACDGPRGYNGYYGSVPSGYSNDAHRNDGTIAPAGALGSIVFLPEKVKDAISYFETIEGLKGKYGYFDAYNFEGKNPWIARDVIGIDKGITLLMMQNYKNDMIWDIFMENQSIQNGLTNLEFTTVQN